MKAIKEKFVGAIASDLRSVYRCPPKSFTTNILTKVWNQKNKPLVKAVIDKLDVKPDDNILEIGYGRGNGISYALEKIKDGKGWIFGLETSPYMEELARKKFALEIVEDGCLFLDHITNIANLPYPNNTFSGIYHVDVYYFWQPNIMPMITQELFRILKPGGFIVTGLVMDNLKVLEKKGILNKFEYNPMRYMEFLEPAGFENVSVTYEKPPSSPECMIITATKPQESKDDLDPEAKMKELEMIVKERLALESLISSKTAMSESLKTKLHDAKGL